MHDGRDEESLLLYKETAMDEQRGKNYPEEQELSEFDFGDILTDLPSSEGMPSSEGIPSSKGGAAPKEKGAAYDTEKDGAAAPQKQASPANAPKSSGAVRQEGSGTASAQRKGAARPHAASSKGSASSGAKHPAGFSSKGFSSDNRRESQAEAPKEKKPKTRLQKKRAFRKAAGISVGVMTWIKDIAIALLIFWVLRTYVAGFMVVPNNFMSPLVEKGEHIVISKIGYRFTTPGRGEIVSYKNSDSSKETLLGRIIGLPGDTIIILTDGSISINGIPFKTGYSDGTTKYISSQTRYPLTVPEGEYFILCDNPDATTDSRYSTVGTVSQKQITGKVLLCYWPMESWRPIAQGITDKGS